MCLLDGVGQNRSAMHVQATDARNGGLLLIMPKNVKVLGTVPHQIPTPHGRPRDGAPLIPNFRTLWPSGG